MDYQIRELCWWSCVNFIANAIGRCEIRTYVDREEVRNREYWMWNYEPNANQNSTAFWHKAIAKLYEDNELLIIPTRRQDGYDAVVIADDWNEPDEWPSRQNEYRKVSVGDFTYDTKTFYESDVIHLRLNHTDMRPVIKGLYESYYRLVQAAIKAYQWDNGKHWKVHVSQVARGSEGWEDAFQKMMEAQVKPFFESNGAILPEFDGYKYEDVGTRSGSTSKETTRDIRALIDDIFTFTARGVGIPEVLLKGGVEQTGDAMKRALTVCIDPICDQFTEEATRTRYGFERWQSGSYLRMDSSAIQHFDLFGQAASIEKLIGSGWSFNDIRRAAGEEIINEPWADQHFMTKNFALLSTLGAQEGGNENE